jgi:probable HAF family extracellular repeat protein
MQRALRFGFAVLLTIVTVSALSAAQQYTVTDLGTLGNPQSEAHAVSDNGQVAGWLYLSDGTVHAFYWSRGTGMLDLGLLHPDDGSSGAYGVNDAGAVVGFSGTYGFLWTKNGGMQDIGNLGSKGSTVAEGINNSGQIVGGSLVTGGAISHPFLYTTSGGMQDLGSLGGNVSTATAINDSGQVTGFSYLADNVTSHSFVWDQSNGMQDIGSIGDASSFALAINSSKEVVGYTISSSGSWTAFYWNAIEGIKALESPASFQAYATGIGSNSQVVGFCGNNTPLSRGVRWDRATTLQNLRRFVPPNGPYPGYAGAINRVGQIVGGGIGGSSNGHAILLTPIKQPSSQRSKP